MAKINRSVWEIKFHALKQLIDQKIKCLKNEIAREIIEKDEIAEHRKTRLVEQIKILEYIKKRSSRIQDDPVKYIYLYRDN